MKAHVGVDADSGLVHSLKCTAAHEADVAHVHDLLHGQEQAVFADAGYQGANKREAVVSKAPNATWHIAMRPGKRKARYKGLAKNTAQLFTLFGLANLVLARRWLLNPEGQSAS